MNIVPCLWNYSKFLEKWFLQNLQSTLFYDTIDYEIRIQAHLKVSRVYKRRATKFSEILRIAQIKCTIMI